MLYVCKPKLAELLGIGPDTPFRVLDQMRARDDLQPRYLGFDGKIKPNVIKLESVEDKNHAIENMEKVGYVMLHPDDARLEPAQLREPLVKSVKDLKTHFQIVMSYHQGLETDASQALKCLWEMTNVRFTLHMTRLNPFYTERWHLDYTGEHTTAIHETERRNIVASLSLNCSFEGHMKSYIEVDGGWSNTRFRDKLVFLNPRDDLHRVITENNTQRCTMLFRTTELTVPQFRDILNARGRLVEGEAR